MSFTIRPDQLAQCSGIFSTCFHPTLGIINPLAQPSWTPKDAWEIISSLHAAAASLQVAMKKTLETLDLSGSINSTVDSLEEILPRQKGRIPRKVEDLILWTVYLILVSYVLMQSVLLLSKWLCCCCFRRREDPAAAESSQKSSMKRPPFLPSSDSFLPPLRPRPNDEMRPARKKTPECCIFNFCSWQHGQAPLPSVKPSLKRGKGMTFVELLDVKRVRSIFGQMQLHKFSVSPR